MSILVAMEHAIPRNRLLSTLSYNDLPFQAHSSQFDALDLTAEEDKQ